MAVFRVLRGWRALIAGAGLLLVGGLVVGSSAAHACSDTARLSEAQLLRIAKQLAAGDRDRRPTLIQHSAAIWHRANQVAFGDNEPGCHWTYLIAERGHFVIEPGPPLTRASRGTVLKILVDAATKDETEGLAYHYPKLARLGPVTTDLRRRPSSDRRMPHGDHVRSAGELQGAFTITGGNCTGSTQSSALRRYRSGPEQCVYGMSGTVILTNRSGQRHTIAVDARNPLDYRLSKGQFSDRLPAGTYQVRDRINPRRGAGSCPVSGDVRDFRLPLPQHEIRSVTIRPGHDTFIRINCFGW